MVIRPVISSVIRPIIGSVIGQGGSVDPVPSTISGLQLWLDAPDVDTLTVTGNDVTQWDDKSGNGNHAVQTIGGDRFQTGQATLNGLNVLTNTGTNVNILLPSALHTISNGDNTLILVARATGINGRSTIRGRQSINPSAVRYFIESRDNATTLLVRHLGASGITGTTNHGETWQMFGLRRSNDILDALYSTGIAATGSDATSFIMEDFRVGFGFDYAELMIYNRALTNAEIATLQAYIQDKWGVTQTLVT